MIYGTLYQQALGVQVPGVIAPVTANFAMYFGSVYHIGMLH